MLHTSLIIPPFGFVTSRAAIALSHYVCDCGTAIILLDAETNDRWLTATVALPNTERKPEHVWLKTWSENVGVDTALTQAQVIELTGETAPAGFCTALGARFTDYFLKIVGKEGRRTYIS